MQHCCHLQQAPLNAQLSQQEGQEGGNSVLWCTRGDTTLLQLLQSGKCYFNDTQLGSFPRVKSIS